MKKILSYVLVIITLMMVSCEKDHFIKDKNYRNRVEKDFDQKIDNLGKNIFTIEKTNVSLKEMEALEFLYAYMPLGDIVNHTNNFYLENIRSSFKVQKELNWNISDELFRHFVLPIRVNNENLDSSRIVFARELLPLVKGKSMYDAALEVNHWCHSKVVYKPTDGRTSSPLASLKTAYGRCGEESTFAVAALRSVGIPARQVYTPRWAHTDDNHAWVEVWADGKWYFLGACEPEPVLNLAWFNAPVSRGMLMTTKVFGHYCGKEEKLFENLNITIINVTPNYVPVSKLKVVVKDANDNRIEGARVDFKIYNYAEFYSLATKYTDKEGLSSLTTGLGDMLVWASHNGKYGFKKVRVGKDTLVNIVLDRFESEKDVIGKGDDIIKRRNDIIERGKDIISLDETPPIGNVNLPNITKKQRQDNNSRKSFEDSIRKAYIATFMTKTKAEDFIKKLEIANNTDLSADITNILINSKGNYKIISDFLYKNRGELIRATKLLNLLTKKDLRDVTMDVLDDNMYTKNSVLSPRVESEMLYPYKEFFINNIQKSILKEYNEEPQKLVEWCKKNISLDKDAYSLVPMNPVGVWKLRKADLRSLNIFFVALARTAGIESRKDIVTGKIQYKNKNGLWIDVNFIKATNKLISQGKLVMSYKATKYLENPKYYHNFTISKLENGIPHLLNYDLGNGNDENGVSYTYFKKGVNMDVGNYILVTGTRLASGEVLSNIIFFSIKSGETTNVDLLIRDEKTSLKVIGSFDSESKFYSIDDKMDMSFLQKAGRGYFVVGILGVNQEPTNHALKDISKCSEELEKWGRKIILLFPSKADMNKYKTEYKLPSNVIFGIDKDASVQKQIANNMKLKNENLLPIFIFTDTFDRIVYTSQGYTIGLGERIMKVINGL